MLSLKSYTKMLIEQYQIFARLHLFPFLKIEFSNRNVSQAS